MNFNQLYAIYEENINRACIRICKGCQPHKIEFEDLKQEALIKLWQLSKENISDKEKIIASIRNCLLNYIKHEKLNPLTCAISLDKLLDNELY